MIRPIPEQYGVGFSSYDRKEGEEISKYKEEHTGRYWNYYFTPIGFDWPEKAIKVSPIIIDGFSPNLNKTLHVGHLRNLALAKSLTTILSHWTSCEIVSLLGASLGVLSNSHRDYERWCKFLDYKPKIYYDNSQFVDLVDCRLSEEEPTKGCKIFDGPKGPVIVVRSNGQPTYAFYDLAFAKRISPTHYITGDEQTQHFISIGLGDKHLPMGLVLGADGTKMKSRTGDAPSADEIHSQIMERFKDTPDRKSLAWNVIAWNFLHSSRSNTVRYDPEKWTDPDQPGLYITYTYARCRSALESTEWPPQYPDFEKDINEYDLSILGTSSYKMYYEAKSVEGMDPAPLANFAHVLAKKLNTAYHTEKIRDGRVGFRYAVRYATNTLGQVMKLLGMFPLERV